MVVGVIQLGWSVAPLPFTQNFLLVLGPQQNFFVLNSCLQFGKRQWEWEFCQCTMAVTGGVEEGGWQWRKSDGPQLDQLDFELCSEVKAKQLLYFLVGKIQPVFTGKITGILLDSVWKGSVADLDPYLTDTAALSELVIEAMAVIDFEQKTTTKRLCEAILWNAKGAQ